MQNLDYALRRLEKIYNCKGTGRLFSLVYSDKISLFEEAHIPPTFFGLIIFSFLFITSKFHFRLLSPVSTIPIS